MAIGWTDYSLPYLFPVDGHFSSFCSGAVLSGAAVTFSYRNTFLLGMCSHTWDEVIPGSKAPFWVLLITRNAGLRLDNMKDVSCANAGSDLILFQTLIIAHPRLWGIHFDFFVLIFVILIFGAPLHFTPDMKASLSYPDSSPEQV